MKKRLKPIEAAVRYLGFRPRTEQEIRRYLTKKGTGSQAVAEVVEKLKRIKLIDDEEFVDYWLRRRDTGKIRASRVLKQELARLGVDKQLVAEALGNQRQADRLRAEKLVEKVGGKYDREGLIGYLSRRGFDWDTVRWAVDGGDQKE